MDEAIQLISDGTGVAVIGEKTAVEKYVASKGLLASARELDLTRLSTLLTTASDAAQAAAEIAANSGLWIKLTKESAQFVKDEGLMTSKTPGESHLLIGVPGQVKRWLQAEDTGGMSLLTSPAALSGVAGLMSQVAARQAMAEITDYLARIDEKLDDVRRSQKNEVLSGMGGVALALREARSIRAEVGRVSDVTWSKIQDASMTILTTQAHAAKELQDITEKLEKKSKFGGLAKQAHEVEPEVQMWLGVLARCFQLQDEIADIELDRVLDTSPAEVADHARALQAARQDRLELFSEYTAQLLDRMNVAVGKANGKMVWSLTKSMRVVEAGNQVARGVDAFHELLGIEAEPRSWMPRELTPVEEKSAQAIQGAKDGTPLAAAVAIGLTTVAAVKKKGPGK